MVKRLVLAGFLGVICSTACSSQTRLSQNVTPSEIRSISLGMTDANVKRLLGEPMTVRFEPKLSMTSLEYGDASTWAKSFPLLWVNLKNGEVTEVYGKRYDWWGLSEAGVYHLNGQGLSEAKDFEVLFAAGR